MRKFLTKLFIPNELNNYYPTATKPFVIIGYCVVFLLANFFVFPEASIESTRVLAASIDTSQIIELANKERNILGLGNLTKNDDLTRAALAKGKDMLKKQYWSHYGPSGETPWQFISASGYNYIYAGENLAKDFQNSYDAHVAWMNSPTHKANIVNPNYYDIGVAYVTGELKGKTATIIVEMFGSTQRNQNVAVKPTSAPNINPNEGIEHYTPKILKPENNSVLNQSKIDLIGEAEKGDSIQVFSNDKLLGELPKSGKNFTVNIDLLENQNRLQIQTVDTKTRLSSLMSESINVTVDSTPPDVNSVDYEYIYQKDDIYLLVNSIEKIKKITLTYDGKSEDLVATNEYFYIVIPNYVKEGTLKLFDSAENSSTLTINFDRSSQAKEPIQQIIAKTTNSPASSPPLIGLGAKEIFNLLMISIFMAILSLDSIFLIRYGKVREFASKHGFHLALFVLVIVSILSVFKV